MMKTGNVSKRFYQVRLAAIVALLTLITLINVMAPLSARAADQHFTTPTGNIDCMMYLQDGEAIADCVVQQPLWKNPPAPDPDCDLDWNPYEVVLTSGINNNNVAVSTVSAGWCRGDIGPLCGPNECSVLRYAAKATLGNILCASAKVGVTCSTIRGLKRSFTVSRTTYKIVRQP